MKDYLPKNCDLKPPLLKLSLIREGTPKNLVGSRGVGDPPQPLPGGEKGERIIVDRENYLSYQKNVLCSHTFSLTKTFEILIHNLSILSIFILIKMFIKQKHSLLNG